MRLCTYLKNCHTVVTQYPVSAIDSLLPYGGFMKNMDFDLNDIQHEPTDAQLQILMVSVAFEAKRRAEQAKEALMQRLRDDIAAANA